MFAKISRDKWSAHVSILNFRTKRVQHIILLLSLSHFGAVAVVCSLTSVLHLALLSTCSLLQCSCTSSQIHLHFTKALSLHNTSCTLTLLIKCTLSYINLQYPSHFITPSFQRADMMSWTLCTRSHGSDVSIGWSTKKWRSSYNCDLCHLSVSYMLLTMCMCSLSFRIFRMRLGLSLVSLSKMGQIANTVTVSVM